MGVADGTVLGATKIVNNGPAAERWNLVITGDGYQEAELGDFEDAAQAFVDELFGMPPFSALVDNQLLRRAVNVYRLDVISDQSGADDPVACGGTGAAPATYFDARFCNSGIRRLLTVNNGIVLDAVNAHVPAWHAIAVAVNSPIYGGSGGTVATYSQAAGALHIAIHELGHSGFGLADEYEYWAGCGVDTNRDNHPPVEPAQPNVTIDPNRATNKWRHLVAAATPMPTTENADCAVCDPQPSPVPAGTVGAFEGAHYYHCDAYRPEFDCLMRNLGEPFCAVCRERIIATLRPFLPPAPIERFHFELIEALLYRVLRRIDLVADPIPFDLPRFRSRLQEAGQSELADALSQAMNVAADTTSLRGSLLDVKTQINRLQAAAAMLEAELAKRKV